MKAKLNISLVYKHERFQFCHQHWPLLWNVCQNMSIHCFDTLLDVRTLVVDFKLLILLYKQFQWTFYIWNDQFCSLNSHSRLNALLLTCKTPITRLQFHLLDTNLFIAINFMYQYNQHKISVLAGFISNYFKVHFCQLNWTWNEK